VRKDRMAGLAKAKSSCAAFARTANTLSGGRGLGRGFVNREHAA